MKKLSARLALLDKEIKDKTAEMRKLVEPLAKEHLGDSFTDGTNSWKDWRFLVQMEGILLQGILYDDRGPTMVIESFYLNAEEIDALEGPPKFVFCSQCGEKYKSQTKGIPSIRTCPNGHKWRADGKDL